MSIAKNELFMNLYVHYDIMFMNHEHIYKMNDGSATLPRSCSCAAGKHERIK